jgi:hypothetical protein
MKQRCFNTLKIVFEVFSNTHEIQVKTINLILSKILQMDEFFAVHKLLI